MLRDSLGLTARDASILYDGEVVIKIAESCRVYDNRLE